LIKDLSLALKDPNGKITKYDPDKDGLVKMTDLEAKVDYSLATENVHLPNSLFRHITPSNSNYVRVDNFRLRIDPDYVSENAKNDPQDISNFGGYRLTLKLDNLDAAVPLPLTVGQFTWPFNDSDRDILFYDDISIWYGGQTRDFMGGNVTYQNHAGTDIKRPTGTKTCAGAPGKVIETVTNWPQQVGQKLGSVNNYDAGNYVLIENHSGFWSSCSHLKDVLVKEGDFVKRGQDIGTVDQTGRAPKNSETNFSISIPYKNSPSGRGFPDFYKAWNINNLFNISFWTKDSNKQQPSDPQSPIPDS
jgi:murein DD-endopeptidase MepM/ murein hydrolase activator NlpD